MQIKAYHAFFKGDHQAAQRMGNKKEKKMTIDEALVTVKKHIATHDAYVFTRDENGGLVAVTINREKEFLLALATLVVHLVEKGEDV